MGLCMSKEPYDADESSHLVKFDGGNVQMVKTTDAWDEKMVESTRDGKIVVANFSATWCGPCRTIAPLYVELSQKHPSLMFLVVDVDELTDFSSTFDVKATPTFYFLKKGEQIDKLVGANRVELQRKITAILESGGSNAKEQ